MGFDGKQVLVLNDYVNSGFAVGTSVVGVSRYFCYISQHNELGKLFCTVAVGAHQTTLIIHILVFQ